MSEWITDRRPTYDDAKTGYRHYVWVTGEDGIVLQMAYEIVGDRPWMPIIPPEPYVKPKLQRYIVVPGKRDDRFLELEECEATFDSAVCMSDDVKHIEALNAELLEALEKALDESACDGDQCGTEWHELARAAIAKAKGESDE